MKNKLRMIDINIVSTYMGRFLTIIVTVIVMAITVSALVSKGGMRNHQSLLVEVPPVAGEPDASAWFEPLRDLLAVETKRTVKVQVRGGGWRGGCELYVFPIAEFLAVGQHHGLVPLYEIGSLERRRDAALLIARNAESSPAEPSADDVLFSHPQSVNGFWIQLKMLEAAGFPTPERLESLHFASAPAPGARVVYSVLMGEFPVGACRASDLAKAVSAGGVGKDELTVIRSSPATPETVIACRPADVDYYRRVLARTAARVAAPDASDHGQSAVALLKSKGMRSLRPVSAEELTRTTELFDEMGKRIRASEL
jgi:hypothetical protein